MLILTRRVGETVMVGDDVTVTVLGVKGNQVRWGISAPKRVAAITAAAGAVMPFQRGRSRSVDYNGVKLRPASLISAIRAPEDPAHHVS